jgi:phosphoribosylaminoimidazole carboxylase (NCAIR synthetase)
MDQIDAGVLGHGAVLAAMLRRFSTWLARLRAQQSADVAARWSALAVGATGSTVEWQADGAQRRGVTAGIDFALLLAAKIAGEAADIARGVLESLDCVGVLCVEFFVTRDGRLLINELAPRPHNSGHLTIDACTTCQFEQQLRAICGLPLGSTELLRPAAMANLLGDLWTGREPDWAAACALPDVKLHLYGKLQPRPGRKMGHLTALAADPEKALARVELARRKLTAEYAVPGTES